MSFQSHVFSLCEGSERKLSRLVFLLFSGFSFVSLFVVVFFLCLLAKQSLSVLIGKKSPKHTQFCQIGSTEMKMPNNPAKYEIVIARVGGGPSL